MVYELARLEESNARPKIDQRLLAEGVLAVDLVWSVGGNEVALRAVFPDSFPRLRPIVSLVGDQSSFPERHCNPVDGNLCLLGRDTAQWLPSWTLARLLHEQLASALTGTGNEDPQGEPAEVWWNGFGLTDSYVLVNSEWDIGNAREGALTLRFVAKGGQSPQVLAAITDVRNANRQTIAEWTEPLPEQLRRGRLVAVPWVRVDGTFLPKGPEAPEIQALLNQHPRLCRAGELVSGLYGFFFGVVYTMEVAHGQTGDGWMIGLVHGPKKAFGPKGTRSQQFNTIPTMRAGREDVGGRVPAVEVLRAKKIAIFGLGALGAPLALELARNGCSELRTLDRDIVEPGNSIRWPIGSIAWGRRKTDVLHEFVHLNYPGCTTVPYAHTLGRDPGDAITLQKMIEGADIVIDATAEYGITTLIHDYTLEKGIQLVSLWATPPVAGGVVVRYVPGSGCPACLEYHHSEGSIIPPPGLDDEANLMQPVGCAERTFTGGSFDLQELSLEAFRVVLDGLSSREDSCVATLRLVVDGRRIPPLWRVDPLPKHAKCSCGRP